MSHFVDSNDRKHVKVNRNIIFCQKETYTEFFACCPQRMKLYVCFCDTTVPDHGEIVINMDKHIYVLRLREFWGSKILLLMDKVPTGSLQLHPHL